MIDCNFKFIKTKTGEKVLPFQFYNDFGFITIPVIGKVPFIKKWNFFTKTVHPTKVYQNIAVITGPKSKITVLDIDGTEAVNFYREMRKQNKEKTKFPEALSPSGIHLYFLYNKDLKNSIGLNIGNNTKIRWDIRNGGLVNLPPSSISNKKYKWRNSYSLLDVKLKPMPEWLFNFISTYQK